MKREYSPRILDAIKKFLNDGDWNFIESDGLIRFNVLTHSRIKTIEYYLLVYVNYYIVYAKSSISADTRNPEMMNRIAEFLLRANYGLKNGNFEFDYADGEVRYKTYVNVGEGTLEKETIRRSIMVSQSMFRTYGDGIADVIFGSIDPKEAIDICEGRTSGGQCRKIGGQPVRRNSRPTSNNEFAASDAQKANTPTATNTDYVDEAIDAELASSSISEVSMSKKGMMGRLFSRIGAPK